MDNRQRLDTLIANDAVRGCGAALVECHTRPLFPLYADIDLVCTDWDPQWLAREVVQRMLLCVRQFFQCERPACVVSMAQPKQLGDGRCKMGAHLHFVDASHPGPLESHGTFLRGLDFQPLLVDYGGVLVVCKAWRGKLDGLRAPGDTHKVDWGTVLDHAVYGGQGPGSLRLPFQLKASGCPGCAEAARELPCGAGSQAWWVCGCPQCRARKQRQRACGCVRGRVVEQRWYEPKALMYTEQGGCRSMSLAPGDTDGGTLWRWVFNMLALCSVRWEDRPWYDMRDGVQVFRACKPVHGRMVSAAGCLPIPPALHAHIRAVTSSPEFLSAACPPGLEGVPIASVMRRRQDVVVLAVAGTFHYCCHYGDSHQHEHPYYCLYPDRIVLKCHSQKRCKGKQLVLPVPSCPAAWEL